MARLPNFPHRDQRNEPTKDGKPPENGNYDCVPTSLACAVQYLTGQFVSGDELKDDAKGDAYTGPTGASDFLSDIQQKYACTAVSIKGSPSQLVAAIHTELAAGNPVLLTMPSQWGTVYPPATRANPPFSTHVGVAFADDNGAITVMNPWGGFDHVGNDQYWSDRLCFQEVWSVRKVANAVAVPFGWQDKSGVITAPNGIPVVRGFAQFIRDNAWDVDDLPEGAEAGLSQLEYANPSLGGGTQQVFRKSVLEWTQGRGVFKAWVGREMVAQRTRAEKAEAQLKAANDQITALKAQAALSPAAQAALKEVSALLTQAQGDMQKAGF